jgi:tetratricopeptide (TPR) repeat protein
VNKEELVKTGFAMVAYLCLIALCVGCASRNPYVTGGIIDMQQSRYESAEQQFKKALEIEPGNSDAHMWLGKCYASLTNKWDLAAAQFDTAISMNEAHKQELEKEPLYFWAVYYNAAMDNIDTENWQEAEKHLIHAIELAPDSTGPYNQLSYAYSRQGNDAKAEEALKNGIERVPNDATLRVSLARLKIHDKKNEEAKTILEEVAETNPDNWEVFYYLGLVYASLKDTNNPDDLGPSEKAEEAYARAAAIDSTRKDAFFNLGFTRMRLKNYIGAVEAFKKSVELDPKDEEAWLYLGMSYYQIKEYDLAIEAFDKVILELNPNSADAYTNRGYAKQKKGLTNEAYKDIEHGTKLNEGKTD